MKSNFSIVVSILLQVLLGGLKTAAQMPPNKTGLTINELKQGSQTTTASLYPNPFAVSATLFVNSPAQLHNTDLEVYDVLGRQVMAMHNIRDKKINLNRGNLQTGIYFYRLIDNSNLLTNGKFIIE